MELPHRSGVTPAGETANVPVGPRDRPAEASAVPGSPCPACPVTLRNGQELFDASAMTRYGGAAPRSAPAPSTAAAATTIVKRSATRRRGERTVTTETETR